MMDGRAVIVGKDGNPLDPLPQQDMFLPVPTELRVMLRSIEEAIDRRGLPSVLRGRVSDSPLVDDPVAPPAAEGVD